MRFDVRDSSVIGIRVLVIIKGYPLGFLRGTRQQCGKFDCLERSHVRGIADLFAFRTFRLVMRSQISKQDVWQHYLILGQPSHAV
jgi:hypothetical protein